MSFDHVLEIYTKVRKSFKSLQGDNLGPGGNSGPDDNFDFQKLEELKCVSLTNNIACLRALYPPQHVIFKFTGGQVLKPRLLICAYELDA